MKLKGPLYTASNMRNDPRWKHGDLTRISTLCNQRGVKGNFIECAIRGLQINSSNARKHSGTVREIAEEYLAAREAGSPIEVLTPREELKQLRSTATPAVVQKPTTAPVPKQLTGKRLAEARRLLSFTQQQAAENGGVSQRDVSELESDTKVFIPSTYLAFLGRNGILLNAIFNSELDLSLSAVVQNPTTAPNEYYIPKEELRRVVHQQVGPIVKRNAELTARNEELERRVAWMNKVAANDATVATPSTGTLEKLSEANAQLAEESTALMARNAALEENTLHVQAELRRREEELVAMGKQLAEHEAARAQVDRDYDAWMRRAKNAEAEAAELGEKNASLTAKSAMLTEDYNALARKMAVAHEDARAANEQVERLSQLLSIIHQTAKLGA